MFWLEKTIPFVYRKPIRDGILEWNKAFEKAGFANAIEVRQQPDNADWDPEDINYNTFRWITAGAGFAMGPSPRQPDDRPDSRRRHDFRRRFPAVLESRNTRTFTPAGIAAMTGGPLDLKSYHAEAADAAAARPCSMGRCELLHGLSRELAFGARRGWPPDGRIARPSAKS